MKEAPYYPKTRKKNKEDETRIIRLLEIYTMIAQKKYPSVDLLVDRYGKSRRTIQRDLQIIRSIDNIDYDSERKGYWFTNGDRFKKLSLTQEELITLLTAGQAVSRLGGGLGGAFQRLLEKMTAVANPARKEPRLPFLIKTPGLVTTENFDEYFSTISLCANECRSVHLEYRAQNSKKITERIVDPYGLVFSDGIWIMIGRCHLRRQIRSFALDRIVSVTGRNLYFQPDDDFDLNKYFEKSWGIVDGKEVDVKIRVKAEVSGYILRKEKWHPSEKRKVLSNGDVELSYKISGFIEFKHWAYSWLPYVEFIKPGWFRKKVREELIEAAELHS